MPPWFLCPACDGTRRVVRSWLFVSAHLGVARTMTQACPCPACVQRDDVGPTELSQRIAAHGDH